VAPPPAWASCAHLFPSSEIHATIDFARYSLSTDNAEAFCNASLYAPRVFDRAQQGTSGIFLARRRRELLSHASIPKQAYRSFLPSMCRSPFSERSAKHPRAASDLARASAFRDLFVIPTDALYDSSRSPFEVFVAGFLRPVPLASSSLLLQRAVSSFPYFIRDEWRPKNLPSSHKFLGRS